ncbi:MAG: hypothetical protein VX498_02605, partial [Myxococcota bacterium]|nr:hypothetical protein [Myxococcota bacterium]
MTQRALLSSFLFVLLAFPSSAAAEPREPALPDALEDWVPWVLRDTPELACPSFDDSRLCAWPGRLSLEVDPDGGRFSLDVHADRALDLPLPGSVEHWPSEIRVDRKPGLLRRSGDVPTVHLTKGAHRITGVFEWARLPAQLPVASSIGLIDLKINGRSITHPVREADGSLSLQGGGAAAASEEEEDGLGIEVHRRIDDGVPVEVTTRLKLRVSGQAREEELGRPLTAGFEPIQVTSTLPARLDDTGRLRVQLRPGTWQVTVRSRSLGPVSTLSPGESKAPWPEDEIWVFSAAPAVRAVQLGGVPGVDPQRTSLDGDWRYLPAFRVGKGDSLTITELRRGEADPPPDSLSVEREIWLSEEAGGLVVRDTVSGEFHEGGRLGFLAPGVLGHVRLGSAGRVITQAAAGGNFGVEVRDGRISMTAESAYPDAGSLPAVGWDRDATDLSATLNLPPGWTLLAAAGVDWSSSTWVELWSLLDLFFLLLISLALFKTVDLRWAALGLVVLGISWHEPDAPRLMWLVLLALSALLRIALRPWLEKTFRLARLGVVGVLAIQVVIFSWGQVSTGLFPQLELGGESPYSTDRGYGYGGGLDSFSLGTMAEPEFEEAIEVENQKQKMLRPMPKPAGSPPMAQSAAPAQSKRSYAKALNMRSAQVDPSAVIQTGQGIPKWSWNSHRLQWSGPVASDHSIRLFLLPPWAEALASLLRVLGLVLLGIRLCAPRRAFPPDPGSETEPTLRDQPVPAVGVSAVLLASALLGAGALLLPSAAQAQSTPDHKTLEALKAHLTQPPDCGSECVEVPSIELRAGSRGLRVEAEVHVLAPTAWMLPGPGDAWVPSEVTVDGKKVVALRRLDNGFFALRLEAGRHRVVLTGPARDELSLQFPLVPRKLVWSGRNWSIDGYRSDAPPPRSVTLRRAEGLQPGGARVDSEAGGSSSADLPAWLELERELDIGVPWLVHNTLRRRGPANRAVHTRVPLLPGELVTSSGIVVEAGEARVTLEQGESSRSWDSTLEEVDSLELTAPADQPWMERWELDCSPVWTCGASGLAPTRHMSHNRWSPAWQPWPGESVKLSFARPVPASGATTTVDEATLTVKPGRRVLAADLGFTIRSSQGGEQSIQLPASAEVQSFEVDGAHTPIDVQAGKLVYTLQPGKHRVSVEWRQEQERGLKAQSPSVALSSGAANVLIKMELPDNKWLLWAGGPRWGAVVTLWQFILVLLLAAWLLGRYASTDLKAHHWFILGLGMTQVPLVAPIVVVVWLVALGLRGRTGDRPWWVHDLFQVGLLMLTPIALIMVYWAVQSGLLLQPDMQVAGAGSSGSVLQWFSQRVDGAFPEP